MLSGMAVGLGSPALAQPDASSMGFEDAGIPALQARMKAGKLSSVKLVKACLDRIGAVDRGGPKLNAVIELNPDAVDIAAALDAERKAGRVRGPLHGIPVLVKDNIDTADRMQTTAGSLALGGNIAAADAFVVQRLRAAGAVILGKTNLSEWANFRSSRSTSGWSSRGGQTKNPHVLARNPSGSSSGSGAAVAAALCPVAVGTETDGSIISPSSHCGIVGLKPTVGLLSRSGIIPISKTQDTAGPMARSVRDAAILLSAMTGVDPQDAATRDAEGRMATDYTAFLHADALKGRRIGYEKRHLSGSHHVVTVYEKALADLRARGAELVEVELIKAVASHGTGELTVLTYEFKDGVDRYLSKASARVKSLADVIRYNNAHAGEVMHWFRQELLEASQAKGGLDSAEYLEALQKSTGAAAAIGSLMRTQRLDAVVGVSSGPAPFTDHLNGGYGTGFSFSQPAAMAGFPHVTVPMGFVSDLPVGLSFVGLAWQEGPLLGMAYAYEQATNHIRAPRFLRD
jgi:amidase